MPRSWRNLIVIIISRTCRALSIGSDIIVDVIRGHVIVFIFRWRLGTALQPRARVRWRLYESLNGKVDRFHVAGFMRFAKSSEKYSNSFFFCHKTADKGKFVKVESLLELIPLLLLRGFSNRWGCYQLRMLAVGLATTRCGQQQLANQRRDTAPRTANSRDDGTVDDVRLTLLWLRLGYHKRYIKPELVQALCIVECSL